MTSVAEPIERASVPRPAPAAARVVIVGGGVAGLETLLSLHSIARDRVDVTLLAPERKFVNRSMSAHQPFVPQRGRGIGLDRIASEAGARWHQGTLDFVDTERRRVVTRERAVLPYDMLVLAVGARADREWDVPEVLTYRGGQDGPSYRLLLRQIDLGRHRSVAFVKPGGPSWPLPLYDLALTTAAHCAASARDVQLTFVTPEEQPLGIFGTDVSLEVARLMRDAGISVRAGTYATPRGRGCLQMSPGTGQMRVDRIVTQPRLVGPLLRGIPCGPDRFIQVDLHGRVRGLHGVFAAGDATSFPVKQGGLAAQQADAVAEAIASAVGIEIEPRPFRPVLHGALLTGGSPRYLRADISGEAGDNSTITDRAQWWPPVKLVSRHLGEYLARQTSDASDVLAGAAIPPGPAPEVSNH